MWLPRAERPDAAAVARAEDAQAKTPETPPLRILLVDDHAAVRATTAALLQDSGHEIVEAADGGMALKLLAAARQAFDLLITDYAMPNVSGAEVIAGSRKMRPTLPAIMITGYADPAALPATRRVTLLTKPFTPAQMGEAIRKALPRGEAALAGS